MCCFSGLDEISNSTLYSSETTVNLRRKTVTQYTVFEKFKAFFDYYKNAVKIHPAESRLKKELNGEIVKFLQNKTSSDLHFMKNQIKHTLKERKH